MSSEIQVNCKECGYKGPQEIGNDGFEQEYPFCPDCDSELTFNPSLNNYG